MNIFCKQCSTSICSLCKSSWHRNHLIVPLIQKIDIERTNLAEFLVTGRKKAAEAEERVRNIRDSLKKKVEVSVSIAKQKVEEQYRYVKNELDEAYKEEMEEINKRAEKDLRKLTEKSDKLLKFRDKWRDIEEGGKSMLQEEGSSKFINNVSTFLKDKNTIFYEDQNERSVKRIQYTEPVYKQTGEAKDFRMYLREHLLGFAIPSHRTRIRSQQQSPLSPETSPVKRSQSVPFPIHPSQLEPSKLDIHSTLQRHKSVAGHSAIPTAANMPADLISHVSVGKTKGLNLKRFFGASFMGNSMWICGWNRDGFGPSYTAFYNVDVPDYNVMQREKKWDPPGDHPTIMCSFGDFILFAKKDGNKVHSFDGRRFSTLNLEGTEVTALCLSNNYIYIFDSRYPDRIRFFDPNTKQGGEMATGLKNVEKCDIHMCLMFGQESVKGNPGGPQSDEQKAVSDETIIFSVSYPHAYVRAVRQKRGAVWQLDCRTHPDTLTQFFNPCSVSASEAGDIFIADKGSNKVGRVLSFWLMKNKNLHLVKTKV